MPRRGVSAIVDVNESVKQLENEIRVLNTQKQNLLLNVSNLEKERDGLNKEISNLGNKIKQVEADAKVEADRLTGFAKEKLDKSIVRESESTRKETELNNKLKEVNNLIKSNEGLKGTLNLQSAVLTEKKNKFEEVLELVKSEFSKI